MRVAFYIAAVIAVTTASPNGYYHQEYNYKTSSSSFKNNELQHKTDDQGYYSKDGDLEGRVKPKVSANSEHSEYVNPKLQNRGGAGYYDGGSDFMSQGKMLANSYGAGQVSSGYHSGSQYERNLQSEGLASSDYIGAASGYSGSYSAGTEQLRAIASRLQQDVQRDLQSAVLSQAHQANIAELEAELRRNLTMRLNEVLRERFGAQTIRGGQSYSLSGGRVEARPNYNQQDLEQLQRQIESSLLNELRQEYNYRTSHSSRQTINQQNYEHYESTTTYRPSTYRPIYPNLNVITPQEPYTSYGTKDHQSQYSVNRMSSNVEYTQAPNVVSITTIASNVQRNLNEELNRLLEETQRQYFSESARQTTLNTAPILERLKQDLRQNLTYSLDEELRRHFGTQFQRSGYMFSAGSGGHIGNQYNYNVADLDNLRRQVEENLITKLTRDFEAARQHWITRQQQSHHSQSQQVFHGQSQTNEYNYGAAGNNLRYEFSTPRYAEISTPRYAEMTPRYLEYSTPKYSDDDYYQRPTSASIVPLISSGVKGSQYTGMAGSRYSGYETSGGSNSIGQLQRQLQADLSSQLQAALSQNRAYMTRYSSGSEQRASFDEAYRRLYDELQRNLTQQLHSFEARGASQSYGGVSESQLAQLRSQLQSSLASQLQQGLQQSYSASASYSASSGSSSSAASGAYSGSNSGGYYRAARGSDGYNYGELRAAGGYLIEGEDCQGDDPLTHQYHRSKRSYGYRSRPLGLSTHSGAGYGSGGTYGGYSGYGSHTPVGQEEDDSEIIQSGQGYSVSANHGSQHVGQEIDDTDDTQQVEVDTGFNFGRAPSHGNQFSVGQQEDDSDDTQQIQVDHGFSSIGLGSQKLQTGSQRAPQPLSGTEDSVRVNQKPLNQGVQYGIQGGVTYQGSSKPIRGDLGQTSYGSQSPVGQEEDDSDDTQQTEDNDFGGTGLGGHSGTAINTGLHRQTLSGQGTYTANQGYHRNYQSTYGNRGYVGRTSNYGNSYLSGQHEDGVEGIQKVEINTGFTTPSTNNQLSTFDVEKPLNSDTVFNRPGKLEPINQDSNRRVPQISTPKTPTPQQTDDSDNTRRYQTNSFGYSGALRPLNQLGQEVDETDTLQKPEPSGFGKPPVSEKPKQFVTKPQNQLGQEVDDFDTLQQPEPISGPETANQFVTSLDRRPQNQLGQQVDDSDTLQQPEPFDFGTPSKPGQPNQFNTFETSSKPSLDNGFSTSSTPKNPFILQFGTQNVIPQTETILPLSNNFDINRPSSPAPSVQTQKPIIMVPASDAQTKPQTNSFGISLPIRPINTNIDSTPSNNQVTQPGVLPSLQQVEVPVELKDVSIKVQDSIDNQIDDIIEHGVPFTGTPNQLYKDTLYTLRANITKECQTLLQSSTYSYLNIKQTDVTILEKYLESQLIQKLNEKFRTSFKGETINYQIVPQQVVHFYTSYSNRRDYGQYPGYSQRPLTSSNSFLQREINSQADHYPTGSNPQELEPVHFGNVPGRPTEADSLVNQNAFPQGPSVISSTSPLPAVQQLTPSQPGIPSRPQSEDDRRRLEESEREADLLIQGLRDALQKRPKQDISNTGYSRHYSHSTTVNHVYQPQQEVIQVKLENITPDQLKLIEQIEEDFTSTVSAAVQNEYISNSLDSTVSKYELYHKSLSKLEQEVKRNLTESIDGNVDLSGYARLIKLKFEPSKIADVQKYIEIKLIKKIRSQLKTIYNIETTEETYEIPSGSSTQEYTSLKPVTNDRRLITVKLENITPEQLKVIEQIEDDFSVLIDLAVQDIYASNSIIQTSNYELYRISLNKLEQELKRNLSDSIEGRVTTPYQGNVNLQKYSLLIHEKFEPSKIADLQKYLEIKLIKKIRSQLKRVYHIEITEETNEFPVGSNTQAYTSQRPVINGGNLVSVKLENITPEQLKVIEQIEDDFSVLIDLAIQDIVPSSSIHASNYELYQISLNKLEQELRRNLTESIEGRVTQGFGNPNLQKYFRLIAQKFDQSKIPDLQKYLEIKLSKKIRTQLKKVYHIEITEDTYEFPSSSGTQQYSYQSPVTYETRTVRLENISPAQLKVIRQIEDDVNKQIEDAIKVRISSLKLSDSSSYSYQHSLDALESELKNNITETVQRLCEPGFGQYSKLISDNFDHAKINDLEKYLQIRLINKLRENIVYYSSIESASSSGMSYHSSSSSRYSYGYNRYHSSSIQEPESVAVNQEANFQAAPGSVPSVPLHQGSVKNGFDESQTINADAEIIPSNIETAELTTEGSWWKRFGQKVKQGASNLKQKIVGKS